MHEYDQVLDWPFRAVADIAYSGFQAETFYDELPGGRLLSSKVIQLKVTRWGNFTASPTAGSGHVMVEPAVRTSLSVFTSLVLWSPHGSFTYVN